MQKYPKIVASVFFMMLPSTLFSWAGRGHNVITHVAARLLDTPEYDSKVVRPFLMREEALAHLSNIPDTSWKSSDDIRSIMDAAHFFNIDLLRESDVKNVLDQDNAKKGSFENVLFKSILETGSAPWRVRQLAKMMEGSLLHVHNHPLNKKEIFIVNQFIQSAGLISHYIGDLANPHHATHDADSWETEQGGFHAYFEADVVDALSLGLMQEVFEYALAKKPFETVILPLLSKHNTKDAFAISIALAKNSRAELGRLLNLDTRFSLKRKSYVQEGKKIKAERRAPKEISQYYKEFIVERLAMGADTLAHVWYFSWEKSGSPDLSSFFSLVFPLDLDPLPPDYLF
jgi:hypothetical protein